MLASALLPRFFAAAALNDTNTSGAPREKMLL
jgi:hypothetical protein